MKLRVQCLVKSDGSPISDEEVDIEKIKEIKVPNFQTATVITLRGAAVVQFGIRAPTSFSLVYAGPPKEKEINLSNERVFLRDTGLEEGDLIQLISKRAREEGPEDLKESSVSKALRTEAAVMATNATLTSTTTPTDSVTANAVSALERLLNGESDPNNPNDMELLNTLSGEAGGAGGSDGDHDEEDADEAALYLDNSPDDLYDRLIESVDDLVDMRQRFIADPEGIMRHIQENDPTLYQLIAENQSEFLELVNNEELVKTLQMEKEMDDEEFEDGEEGDFEMTEEEQEAMQQAFLDYVQRTVGGGDAGAVTEGDAPSAGTTVGATVNVDGIAPTEEEEEKIQTLVQLGFTYKQCKEAFYKCHRSVDRAANYLFEHPPSL